jgi:hypothetical protein
MKIKSIVTMDDELTFVDAEVLNVKNVRKLDKAIQKGKIIVVKENKKVYRLNSSFIVFYQP